MNRKERERLVVLNRVRDKELPRAAPAEVLRLSLRQVHRLYLRFVAEGDKGQVHQARGKPSFRKIGQSECDKAMDLYRCTYRGFGPTLLARSWDRSMGSE